MTREAVVRRIVLAMALDAEPHAEALLEDNPVHRFDGAMTVTTLEPGGHVHAMVEMGQVRQIGDTDP